MAAKYVIDGVHIVPMGFANAFLIEGDDGLTLIDAGFPHKEAAVFRAVRGLGRSPHQLKHLIFTHGHPDHIGSAGAIVRESGARTYMHPLDIPMAESGGPFRPMTPAPGLVGQVLCRLFFNPEERMGPVAIDQPLTPGDTLPIAGGIEVIHVPGHCAGQVALLWHPGRMLFAGDVGTNLMGLGDPVGFENLEEGRASQRKLAGLSFNAAGFGHGKPITRDASARFRSKWVKNYLPGKRPKKTGAGADVRFGSQADIGDSSRDVRFIPESGHPVRVIGCHFQADREVIQSRWPRAPASRVS